MFIGGTKMISSQFLTVAARIEARAGWQAKAPAPQSRRLRKGGGKNQAICGVKVGAPSKTRRKPLILVIRPRCASSCSFAGRRALTTP
jgi:hypothetical protein